MPALSQEPLAALRSKAAQNRALGRGDPLPHQTTAGARHGYSLARAIRTLIEDRKPLDGIEAEVSREIGIRNGLSRPPAAYGELGFWVPLDAPYERRAFDTTAGAGGLISPNLGTVVDALRAKLVLTRLGAQTIADLHGTPFLPRRTAAAALGWFTEGQPAPISTQQVTDQVKFSPHSTGVQTAVTRFAKDLVIPDVLDVFIDDVTRGLAVEIDRVGLNGAGGTEPRGIVQDPAVPAVSFGAAGGAPTNALLAAMKQQLGNNNGDDGVSLAFVTTPNAEAALRTNFRNGPGSRALLDGNDFVLGCPFVSTTNLPSNLTHGAGTGLSAAILGSFASVMIGLWPLYLLVDPYKQSTSGVILMTCFQDVDIHIRQPHAFTVATDIVTS